MYLCLNCTCIFLQFLLFACSTSVKPAYTALFLSVATEILSSVVSNEKEFLAYLILKIIVSDKIFYMRFPHTASFRRQRQKSSSSATKVGLCALGFTRQIFRRKSCDKNSNETKKYQHWAKYFLMQKMCIWIFSELLLKMKIFFNRKANFFSSLNMLHFPTNAAANAKFV